jgi:hypothetical protein
MGLRKLFRARQRAAPSKQELPLNLQLLFPSEFWVGARDLVDVLQDLHPTLAGVQVECRTHDLGQGLGIGQTARVQWGPHTVLLAFIQKPAPAEALQWTVDLSRYDAVLSTQVATHAAHATLAYKGQETDPLEQYLALTTIAAGLTRLGAVLVTNVSAFASCPAQPLLPRPGEDLLQVLRRMPLTLLFVGFHKLEFQDLEGVWMRTCGAPLMDMPDLALHARSHEESKTVYEMFNSIFMTMREAKIRFKEGDMVQLEELNWKFRKPRSKERFLDSPRMIVLEPDTAPDRLRLP